MADLTPPAPEATEPAHGVAVSGPDVDGGVAVVRVAGELDLSCADQVAAALDAAVPLASDRLVVDLAELRFMDSSGLAVLLRAALAVPVVEIRDPSPAVRRLIVLSGLTSTLPMTP